MQTVVLKTLTGEYTSMTDWSQTNSAFIVVVICLGRDWSVMIKILFSELEQIRARHKVYMRERMQVLISDALYLWWDWAFVNRFEKILKKYEELMTKRVKITHNECMNAKTICSMSIRFEEKDNLAHRFTYAVATVLPLSRVDLIRHECNNVLCIDLRHLMMGDHEELR